MIFLNKKTPKQIIGKKGEDIAVKFLKEEGYEILDRNYRSKRNEIDIVASDRGVIVFVEVKSTATSSAQDYKLPSEAVDRHKRECLVTCAIDYIGEKKRKSYGYRFDVIEVYLFKGTPEINHIKNAFYIKERTNGQWNR